MAVVVHDAEVSLRVRYALLCGLAIPLDRLGVVLRHAVPVVVHDAKRQTCVRFALLRGLAKSPNRFGKIPALVCCACIHEKPRLRRHRRCRVVLGAGARVCTGVEQ